MYMATWMMQPCMHVCMLSKLLGSFHILTKLPAKCSQTTFQLCRCITKFPVKNPRESEWNRLICHYKICSILKFTKFTEKLTTHPITMKTSLSIVSLVIYLALSSYSAVLAKPTASHKEKLLSKLLAFKQDDSDDGKILLIQDDSNGAILEQDNDGQGIVLEQDEGGDRIRL